MEILISIAVSITVSLLGYIVIYSLKPKLVIAESNDFLDNKIRLPIFNKGRHSAVNLRIEVCALDRELSNTTYTYHLNTDHQDFLILPPADGKTFIVNGISDTALGHGETYESILNKLQAGIYELRVRIHSYHDFSGLGKAEVASFTFKDGKFIKKMG